MRKVVFGYLFLAALVLSPLFFVTIGHTAVPGVTPQTCTPDQIVACVNGAMSGVNNNAVTCSPTGCTATGATAPPVLTGNCVTAGGGTSALSAGASAYSGRVTCTSTANTSATLTWATARGAVPQCVITGETVALTTFTNSTTAIVLTYASTASPIFDYICSGQ